MKLRLREKRLLWLFFITLLFNTFSNILTPYLSGSLVMVISISLLVVALILEIFLVILSIKEIKRGNKALGIIVIVLSIIDILMIVLSVIISLLASYSIGY